MAVTPDGEVRRGLFGAITAEHAIDLDQDTDTIINSVHSLIISSLQPNGGSLQHLHPLRGWSNISLDEARVFIEEHIATPHRRDRSVEQTTILNPKVTITTGCLQVRKPGEPSSLWNMNFSFRLHENRGDGNFAHSPSDKDWKGQPKGHFYDPYSLRIRQLAQ